VPHLLKDEETVVTEPFGGFCPYWTRTDENAVWIGDSAEDLLGSPGCSRKQLVLNPVSVLSLLDYNYIHGERTMVCGVYRMPWNATLSADGSLTKRRAIPHGTALANAPSIARGLRERLEDEIGSICQNRERVVILLSGGLDSRVTAGILHSLYASSNGPSIEALTWGSPLSRDCVYAQRICDWFGWPWKNVPIDSANLPEMIRTAAVWGGAETSGIHLHGMDSFADQPKGTLVLASSFGDSVGRAEFSHVKLANLTLSTRDDRLRWIRPVCRQRLTQELVEDMATAWQGYEDAPEWVRGELNQQQNYMRRMIVHAMNRIRQWCDLYQVFTAREVVEYMWSFAPQCRTDQIYSYLLRSLDERLWRLPWARNGVAPSGDVEPDKTLTEDFADYMTWCHGEHRAWLESLVFSEELARTRLFDRSAIWRRWRMWLKDFDHYSWHSQSFTQLAMLALFIRHYRVKPPDLRELSMPGMLGAYALLGYRRLCRAGDALLGRV
jgi:hypothetical protein